MEDWTKTDLLSIDKIVEALQDKSPQDKIYILSDLRDQAKQFKITPQFTAVKKAAEDKLAYNLMREQAGRPIKDLPECIKSNADYSITELGVFFTLGKTLIEVCPYPLFITERYTDLDDGTEKVKLEFRRDQETRSIIVPRNTIANSNKIIQLSDQATGINSENAKAVVKYLSDIESVNRYTIPVKHSVSRLGWTQYGFVPFIDDIVFTGADQYAQLFNSFHTEGDYSAWKDISVQCLQYTIPKIITAASYASLLLKQIGVNGFCVHLWGESGRGKTVALMLGASVYGDADPKNGIIRNGKTTSNGVEPVLGFFNHCAVFFDELTTLSQDQITDMVYKFAQGQGKGRMTKNAGLQKSFTWNNVAILSAEKPLFDSRTMSGAINRVISVYSEGSVFGDLDMVEIANTLKDHYGFGAKIFIDALKHTDVQAIYEKHIQEIPSDIEQKQANAAAVLLTAYEIAARNVYNIDSDLTAQDLYQFLAKKADVSVSLRAYDCLISYIQANYTMFDDSDTFQSKWGWYGTGNKVVHIFYARFQEWIQRNGYQEQALLREWRARGLIKTRSKSEFKNNAKFGGKLVSDVITIVLPEENHQIVMEEVTTGEELPF